MPWSEEYAIQDPNYPHYVSMLQICVCTLWFCRRWRTVQWIYNRIHSKFGYMHRKHHKHINLWNQAIIRLYYIYCIIVLYLLYTMYVKSICGKDIESISIRSTRRPTKVNTGQDQTANQLHVHVSPPGWNFTSWHLSSLCTCVQIWLNFEESSSYIAGNGGSLPQTNKCRGGLRYKEHL